MLLVKEKKDASRRQFSFQSYGVKIGIRAESRTVLETIESRMGEILPFEIELIEASAAERILDVELKGDGFVIYSEGELVIDRSGAGGGSAAEKEEIFFNIINSRIRLTVAEYAVGKVFLHAGAVGWNGRAVIFPGSSFAGKSSLVAALIKRGALYYSDEYAVLDENGLVSPFPKTLSLRGIKNEYAQVERSAESLGGKTGVEPIPVGLVLVCQYDKDLKNGNSFAPEILSAGQGALEIMAHAIPVRFNPKFTVETLYKISSRAIIAKCRRGEAEDFSSLLIDFLNELELEK